MAKVVAMAIRYLLIGSLKSKGISCVYLSSLPQYPLETASHVAIVSTSNNFIYLGSIAFHDNSITMTRGQ